MLFHLPCLPQAPLALTAPEAPPQSEGRNLNFIQDDNLPDLAGEEDDYEEE